MWVSKDKKLCKLLWNLIFALIANRRSWSSWDSALPPGPTYITCVSVVSVAIAALVGLGFWVATVIISKEYYIDILVYAEAAMVGFGFWVAPVSYKAYIKKV